ncbi:pentapeptide repeat-containing protein [Nocardia sp. 004]|uniref:pentapeptide repeat-containing protein n=1 Tax=Nocardia sp. 004 TaxID=3385978 RepID=UPI0039A00E27
MPRGLTDLPFTSYLEPAETVCAEGEYDCAQFDGITFTDPDARNARFTECVFRSVRFDQGMMQSARFGAVWMHGVRLTGTDLSDTVWLDAEVIEGAFSGVEAAGAELRRVVFHGCKLDSVNLRGAELASVSFVDCVVRHLDIGDANVSKVSFPGSEIAGLSLRHARLTKVDFRGARSITVADGVEALKGAIVTSGQVMELAPAFAASIGLTVEDE